MTGASAEAGRGTPEVWPDAATELRSIPVPWWAVLATGLCGVASGAAVLVRPDVALRIMAALAGVWLLVAGIAWIIGALRPGSGGGVGRPVLSGVVGVVALVAGLICLRDPVSRLAVLALFFAVTWISGGLAGILLGLRRTGGARTGLAAAGVISLIAGIAFLLLPDLSLTALVLLTGAGGLAVGLAEVGLALVLHRSAIRQRL